MLDEMTSSEMLLYFHYSRTRTDSSILKVPPCVADWLVESAGGNKKINKYLANSKGIFLEVKISKFWLEIKLQNFQPVSTWV